MVIKADGRKIADKVREADSFVSRFKGLMLKKNLEEGEGLLLKKCGSIHTCFMRFPIDVIYLSADNVILAMETVGPWRIGKLIKGAKNTLELPEGYIEKLQTGAVLEMSEE